MSKSDDRNRALEMLDDAAVVSQLRAGLPAAIEQLRAIACGEDVRNSQSILAGIKVLLQYSQPLPKQVLEHQGSVGIQVINPFAKRLPDVVDVTPALPVKSTPPLLRRKRADPTPTPRVSPAARGDMAVHNFSIPIPTSREVKS